jgi:Cd(II)/Pb(II)-responsive transcriptional regulator
MQIKELARATGVDVETIRYYEKQGLLPEPARRDNGYRDYAAEHLERLSFIRHCRALDMPLAEVNRLLGFVDAPSADCRDVDLLVDEQLARVRARLKSMRALEKQLLQLRARCSGSHEGQHCGILAELVSAAHGEACVCHAHANQTPYANAPMQRLSLT